MKLKTLRELYIHELKDVYSAEKQLTKALPKMAKAATNEELASGFEDHLAQTEKQIERLDQIFEALGVSAAGEKCKGMEGLIAEGSKLMEEDASPEVLDAGLIAAAQKAEHYEIASYGTLRTWAEMLGEDDAASLLQETLDEEIETDEKLSEMAESTINVDAETADSD